MNTRHLRFRSNRVGDINALFHADLDPLYGRGEVEAFLAMLYEAFLGWDRVRQLTSRGRTVDQSDLLRFHWALEDLKRSRPIQHIIGHVDFCGCRIRVTPDVLIPRPETEEMVAAIARGEGPDVERVLDLCTGSGCIAIALKRAFPQAGVTAVDLSAAALEVARRNAEANGAEVRFVQDDILRPEPDGERQSFSIIVSNPPYVRESERKQMAANVLDHEPEMALFVPDDDPLRFYRAIAAIATRRLAPAGLLAVEINEALAEETCALLRERGFETTVHEDFRGKPRWVSARGQAEA